MFLNPASRWYLPRIAAIPTIHSWNLFSYNCQSIPQHWPLNVLLKKLPGDVLALQATCSQWGWPARTAGQTVVQIFKRMMEWFGKRSCPVICVDANARLGTSCLNNPDGQKLIGPYSDQRENPAGRLFRDTLLRFNLTALNIQRSYSSIHSPDCRGRIAN